MNKTTIAFAVSLLAALALAGAGCVQDKTAIAPQSMNDDSALSRKPSDFGSAASEPQVIIEDNTNSAGAVADEAAKPAAEKPAIPTKFPGVLPTAELKGKMVHIQTAKGEIVFELLPEEGPKAASNFFALARSGYYDGLKFHRVEPGFVIQGGDPSGNGTGGPGYEFGDDPVRLDYKAGIVAMANKGPDTNGSQFFIILKDAPTLGKNYSIFGRVVSGMDVVLKIAKDDVMSAVTVTDAK